MKKNNNNILIWLVAFIIKCLMQIIGRTVRVKVIKGRDILEELQKNPRPVIFSFWHNRIFYASYFLYRHVFKKGLNLTVLISQSKDGEWIAKIVHMWGGNTVRGSTTRGGLNALKKLCGKIMKEKSAAVTTPDGPKGPVYKFQAGTITLSQITQVPIIPVTFAAKKAWVFNSWDKFIVPKPFTKAYFSFGKPILIPREINVNDRENLCQNAEKAMMDLLEETEKLLYEG
ncbi:MAG: lysophospholipid acyltransferase family protein [Spirochaetia bacterium]|nr:lysophospholipid acyltransferase family protein [Spirochaetia bacterium]